MRCANRARRWASPDLPSIPDQRGGAPAAHSLDTRGALSAPDQAAVLTGHAGLQGRSSSRPRRLAWGSPERTSGSPYAQQSVLPPSPASLVTPPFQESPTTLSLPLETHTREIPPPHFVPSGDPGKGPRAFFLPSRAGPRAGEVAQGRSSEAPSATASHRPGQLTSQNSTVLRSRAVPPWETCWRDCVHLLMAGLPTPPPPRRRQDGEEALWRRGQPSSITAAHPATP